MTGLALRPKLAPQPEPRLAPWLTDATSGARAAVIRRALAYCGVQETPRGSNRGEHIDRWLRWAGVPEALILKGQGWWCAAFVGGVLRESGLAVPLDYASCDAWLPWMTKPKSAGPALGDIVLYGVPGDARHIGLVVTVDPDPLTVEGNRAFGGMSNNGVAVDIGPLARPDILGYVPLEPFA